jgi:hypothetical protein
LKWPPGHFTKTRHYWNDAFKVKVVRSGRFCCLSPSAPRDLIAFRSHKLEPRGMGHPSVAAVIRKKERAVDVLEREVHRAPVGIPMRVLICSEQSAVFHVNYLTESVEQLLARQH